MAQAAVKEIGPKEAVALGFRYFKEFFADSGAKHVLLESLEFLEEEKQWKVVISFDAGKKRETSGPFAAIGEKTVEPVSEARAFLIDAQSGEFVSLQPA